MQIINASEVMPSTFPIAFDFYLEHMWPIKAAADSQFLIPPGNHALNII